MKAAFFLPMICYSSETTGSQSGIKLSFNRSPQPLTIERVSAYFVRDMKLSWKNEHLSPSISSILQSKVGSVHPESC